VAVAAAAAEDLLVVEARPAAVAAAEAPRRWVDVVTRPVAAAAQLVVGLAAPGVAKRFVGLVDRLELVLGTGLLADVGMVFACKTPVGGLDLGVAGTGFDTQDRVVILELHAVSTRATAAVRRGGRLAISGRGGATQARGTSMGHPRQLAPICPAGIFPRRRGKMVMAWHHRDARRPI